MSQRRRRWPARLALVTTMAVGGCYRGSPDAEAFDPGADDDGRDPDGEPTPPSQPLCSGNDAHAVPGPRLLRRLTAAEYETSVRHALQLGEEAWTGPTLPPDPAASTGYPNDADRLRVGEAQAVAFEDNAVAIATLVSGPAHLGALLPCATEGTDACAAEFLDGPGRRLFRRSLSDDERARYLALLDEVVDEGGQFEDWVRWTVQTQLQSPHFLYRSELGDPTEPGDGWFELTGPEIATLLAFTLTGAPADDALMDEAEAGGLDTPDAILAAATALAFDDDGAPRPALRQRLQLFHRQWLGLSTLANLQKDPDLYPGFDDAVKASMVAEIEAFVDDVVFEQRGDVADLLTTNRSQFDATLADYYGHGDDTGPTIKPDGWGVGLLSLGGVLATHATYLATSPTQRGKLVRGRLLCLELPPPPPDVGDLPPVDAAQTTRQRYEEHVSNPSCAGCHIQVDPIGFGLEGIDAAGRYRSTDNGYPLDLTGLVYDLDGEQVDFEGATQLAEVLADAEKPALCMTAHMATFALGLPPEQTECIVDGPAESLAAGDTGIVDAYVAFSTTPHFRRRQNR
ncbi:MAG: DUF1592 domain-containing protein [Deltaproteobacteria bacterium]|nr:DUF1592 domain-containing protein [Deltaproteobacteria bacterium]